MTVADSPTLEFRTGAYYSNGAYGRSWGVREMLEIDHDSEPDKPMVKFRGIAGVCRRKTGTCSLQSFAGWARYEVALNENSWHRVGYFADEPDAGVGP